MAFLHTSDPITDTAGSLIAFAERFLIRNVTGRTMSPSLFSLEIVIRPRSVLTGCICTSCSSPGVVGWEAGVVAVQTSNLSI